MSDRIFEALNEISMILEGLQSNKDLINLEVTNIISSEFSETSEQIVQNLLYTIYQSKQSSTSLIQLFNRLQNYLSEDL